MGTSIDEGRERPRRRSGIFARTPRGDGFVAIDAVMRIGKAIIVVAGAGAIIVSAAGALGFHTASPKASLEAVNRLVDSSTVRTNRRVDSSDLRITSLERRADAFENKQNFTNYLLCVQMRTTNPIMLPSDCAPIIQARTTP